MIASDRIDRALSYLAVLVAWTSVVGTVSLARVAYGACPVSRACGPALLGTIFGCVMSVSLAGACYLFRPRD